MALIEKLTAIADAIRSKTGGTGELTLDQMAAVIAGIEAGGGLAYDMGEFVLDGDTINGETQYVPHKLGEKPEFVLVWTDAYVGVTNPDTVYPTALGFVWLDGFMGLDNWYTSSVKGEGAGTTVNFTQSKGGTGMNVVKPTSASYAFHHDWITETEFPLVKVGSTTYWRGGITYKYFVSKAWWNVGGVANAE